jgi:2,4-dienoyl-CoA reductase (NADPH2)
MPRDRLRVYPYADTFAARRNRRRWSSWNGLRHRRGEELGGQLQLARRIPGKSEFDEYLRYSAGELRRLAVDVRFGARATAQDLLAGGFDRLVLATGVAPRMPQIEGIGHPKVVSYPDAILGKTQIGRKVAIIGTGGIGFDVAFALLAAGAHDERAFYDEWGVDPTLASPGGLKSPVPPVVVRDVVMLQRNDAAPGSRLGKSTGWILRAALRKRNVAWLTSCEYLRITDEGLHVKVAGVPRVVDCDTVVVCAGQESVVDLLHPLAQAGMQVDLIGGARFAAEVDAFRAIDEGTRLAYSFGGRND